MTTEPQTTNPSPSLGKLEQDVINAACRWRAADIYVHPVLDRATAVKVGVADLIDAVQNYKSALPPAQVREDV